MRHSLLDELKDLNCKADVILNDFENAHIDASTLEDRTASIHPIAASCACCGSLEELVQLCLAAQRSEGDVLLIELNGTADPLPLLETFTLLEKKMPFLPRWQVGVIDARHWGLRNEFAPLEERQVESATHWILTHTQVLTNPRLESVSRSVRRINLYAKKVDASQLAADLVIKNGSTSIPLPPLSENVSVIEGGTTEGHALSHRLTGLQIPIPGCYRRDQIMRLLIALPDDVVRAKALVTLKESPGSRWLFQRTGHHPIDTPLKVTGISRTPTALVCIGPCLDPETLRELTQRHLGSGEMSA